VKLPKGSAKTNLARPQCPALGLKSSRESVNSRELYTCILRLRCGNEELEEFIDKSRDYVDGWISFYWGRTIEENEKQGDLPGAVIARWLRTFRSKSPVAETQP
jgi:hypothetical protein